MGGVLSVWLRSRVRGISSGSGGCQVFRGQQFLGMPVHCECHLIQFLETEQEHPWGGVAPFNYIGVSKLA